MTAAMTAALALGLALAAPRSGAAADAAASFDYVHVEANEGSASGGHVALRFGRKTFHFQYRDGFLRLQRDDSHAFVHRYARLENRDLHVQRVAVSQETRARLRRRFNDRYLLEERQFALLDALRADRDLLAALAGGTEGSRPTVAVPVAGLFACASRADAALACAGTASTSTPASAAREALRVGIAARHGADLAARRAAATDAGLAALAPRAAPAADAAPATHAYPDAPATLAQRASELLSARVVLGVLRAGTPLRADAVRDVALPETELTEVESAALRRFADLLATRLAALASSPRPDWGGALLLGIARLETLARSVADGRLVVLDAYPEDAAVLTPAEVQAQADLLPALLDDARADLAAARRALRDDGPLDEARYSALESAANRFLELQSAYASGTALRLAPGTLLPSRSARLPLPDAPELAPGRVAPRLAAAEARLAAWEEGLRRVYAYDLLGRNCVSEVFVEIGAALDDEAASPAAACAASRERLGGCVTPDEALQFIPFLSARAVAREYAVAGAHDVPSHRTARLAEMYERENDVAVFLRESNVLTSTIYRGHAEDSPFLFFTDDAVLPRPLFGALNLATGVGASAAGLLLLPTGDTELLLAGLRGALFSVPELAFVSLRKGSFAWVPREDDDHAGDQDDEGDRDHVAAPPGPRLAAR